MPCPQVRLYIIEPVVGWGSAKFLACETATCGECGGCTGDHLVVGASDTVVTMAVTSPEATSPAERTSPGGEGRKEGPTAVLGYTPNTNVVGLPATTPRASIETGARGGSVQVVARSESAMRAMANLVGDGRRKFRDDDAPLVAIAKGRDTRAKEEALHRKAEADREREKNSKAQKRAGC